MAHSNKALLAAALAAVITMPAFAQDAQYPMAKTYSTVEAAIAASRSSDVPVQQGAQQDPMSIQAKDGQVITNIEIFEKPVPAAEAHVIPAATKLYESPTQTYRSSYVPSANAQYGYSVMAGDTLYSIARSNGLKTSQLMNANGLSSSAINIGQQLIIPSQGATTKVQVNNVVTSQPSVAEDSKVIRTVQPIPSGANVYRVLPGDTLYSIARLTCSTVDSIASASNVQRDGILTAGQSLTLPEGNCAN